MRCDQACALGKKEVPEKLLLGEIWDLAECCMMVLGSEVFCFHQVLFERAADFFQEGGVGLGCIDIFDAGTSKKKAHKCLKLAALEEERWQLFEEAGAQSKEIVDEVGVELTILASRKRCACLLADELESLLKERMVLLESMELNCQELDTVHETPDRVLLVAQHRLLDEVLQVRLELVPEDS